MKSIYVGIDISKETLDFCIKEKQQFDFEKIENKKGAIRKVFKKLNKKDAKIYIAMENTGNYNFKIYTVLEEFDFDAYVVDPRHIKQSIGLTRGKNDKVDARRIAVFIEKNHKELDQWEPETQAIQTLKVLMTERRFKIKMRSALKQKNTEMSSVISNEYTKRMKVLNKQEIKKLTKDIKEIEALIRQAVAEDKELSNDIKRIRTVPGIGKITAWTLAAKTKGFTRLTDPRKLGCYAGVVPFEQQSGTSLKTKPRVSKKADHELKTVLQMAAMRAVRMENDLQHYYLRKVEEGKNEMSVLNAVRNKLLHIAMALIKNKTFYENRLVLS